MGNISRHECSFQDERDSLKQRNQSKCYLCYRLYLCLSERKQLGGQLMCFEPSQPLGIISGLGETFIKRYVVERTNKAEIRPEEQSEKTENCPNNLWNEIQLKGP